MCMRIAAVVLTLISALSGFADSWAGARPVSIFSADGSHFVRITPGDSIGELAGFAGAQKGVHARGEFYVRRANASYERIADVRLRNPVAPVEVIVTNNGSMITLDNWHNAGYGEVLVVYDSRGKVIRSYRLEDLYEPPVVASVPATTSSRWWRCRVTGFVDPGHERELYIGEFRGGEFVLTVATGAIRYEAGQAPCRETDVVRCPRD